MKNDRIAYDDLKLYEEAHLYDEALIDRLFFQMVQRKSCQTLYSKKPRKDCTRKCTDRTSLHASSGSAI